MLKVYQFYVNVERTVLIGQTQASFNYSIQNELGVGILVICWHVLSVCKLGRPQQTFLSSCGFSDDLVHCHYYGVSYPLRLYKPFTRLWFYDTLKLKD